jgi:hypothetical protein
VATVVGEIAKAEPPMERPMLGLVSKADGMAFSQELVP